MVNKKSEDDLLKRLGEIFFQTRTQKIIVVSLAILVVLVGYYSFRSIQYADRLLPKTRVNQIDVGGLTLEQANEKVIANFSEQPFTIQLDQAPWKKIKRTELGWANDYFYDLAKIKQEQQPFAWGMASIIGTHYQLPNTYDKAKVSQLTENLKNDILQKNTTRVPTVNATIEWRKGKFTILPEKQGETIDVAAVQEALRQNLETGKSSVNAEDYYAQPILMKKDSRLQKAVDKLNDLSKIKGIYTVNGNEVKLSSDELRSWLTTNEQAEVTLKQDKVTAFVTKLNEEHNTKNNPTRFNSTLRGAVSVPVGIYNWSIDIPAEVKALSDQILKGEDFNRTPITEAAESNVQAGIGNTYVEVDLQNQHMWFYKEGNLQLETPIVSGKPSTPTPPGVNYVTSKSMNQILRGLNDDGSKYASPVSYWMPIDQTGVGIHDSNWQSAYGGDLWLYRGSHGCINTPPDKMSELYPMLEVGTPVLVF